MRINRFVVRLLAPWLEIRRLQKQVNRLDEILSNPLLAGIEISKERGLEIDLKGSGPQLLAGMF